MGVRRILTIVLSIFVMVIAIVGCATQKKVINNILAGNSGTELSTSDNQIVDKYNVVKGDCLWDIAGKKEIYNDSFAWPLIYRANAEEISDPDIIEVNQVLNIERDCDIEVVEEAVKIAKEMPPYKRKK